MLVTVSSNGKSGEDGPLTPLFKALDNAWSDLFLTNKITTVSIAILKYDFRAFVDIDCGSRQDLLRRKTQYFMLQFFNLAQIFLSVSRKNSQRDTLSLCTINSNLHKLG